MKVWADLISGVAATSYKNDKGYACILLLYTKYDRIVEIISVLVSVGDTVFSLIRLLLSLCSPHCNEE